MQPSMRDDPTPRGLGAWIALLSVGFGLGAPPQASPRGSPQDRPPTSVGPGSAGDEPSALAPERALPCLDHEPLLRVFLASGERVPIQVEAPARLEASGGSSTVGPGTLVVEAVEGGWRFAGDSRVTSGDGVLRSGGRPIFALDATPLFGEVRPVRLSGDLILHPGAGVIEVIERLPMEAYLASVVGAEMNPKWPREALAAQAIVARSYAAARWMERADRAWDLHWHFGVDMAYHGWSESVETVARAIAPTRGEVLMVQGFPVLALFHASSGGRTEAFERVKPGVLAPDGKTSIAAAMPVVDDDAALPGAAGLGLSDSHGRWRTELPLSAVTAALREWSGRGEGRPVFGEVGGVSIEERYPDSGRVESVSIRHRLDGATRFTRLSGADFRLAVGPVRIRSLWWERCEIAGPEPSTLVLEGRGFGHGCGLSQVSAWYLATRGEAPETIVSHFYAGATLGRRY